MSVGAAEPVAVPIQDVEQELTRQLKAAQIAGQVPFQWARMSNLVVACRDEASAAVAEAQFHAIIAVHPARLLLLIGDPRAADAPIRAEVKVEGLDDDDFVCSELVRLRAGGPSVERLIYAVRGLIIGDLPTNLWWANAVPPSAASVGLMNQLTDQVEQVIYDSTGWADPRAGVEATTPWLHRFEHAPNKGPCRVASDLNWRRLKTWRRVLGQALDPETTPGALESIREVVIEHGPHAVIQGWMLASWLASRLGWKVRVGHDLAASHPELDWDLAAPQGIVRVAVRRLPEGPPGVRRVRVEYREAGQVACMEIVAEGGDRIAVIPCCTTAAPRTVSVGPQPLADLLGRQLSDREHDPIFRQTMALAQVLARAIKD